MIPRSFILLCAACAVVTVAGCDAKSPSAPPSDNALTGVYHLQSVNGFPLPQIIEDSDGTALSIVSGTVTLTENEFFTDSTDLQVQSADGVSLIRDVTRGFFNLTPDSVTFFVSGTGQAYRMGRRDNTLTQLLDLSGGDALLVYRR